MDVKHLNVFSSGYGVLGVRFRRAIYWLVFWQVIVGQKLGNTRGTVYISMDNDHVTFSGLKNLRTKLLLVSASALLFFGCAYFNTFYNAETAFQSGFRKHSKIMEKYPDSLVVTPSQEIQSLYDRAIEKSLKMMDVYPREKKLRDRAYFLMGKAAFYKKDFTGSIGYMRELQAQFPSSPLIPESYLYVAKSHILEGNLGVAEEVITTILDKYPHLDDDNQIPLLLVDIAIRRGGRSQAIGLLQKIRISTQDKEERLLLLLRMAELHLELKQYPLAYNLLQKAQKSKGDPYLMFRVDRSIYQCYDAQDSLSQALELLDKMLKDRSYRDYHSEILFYKGVTLRKMGRIAESLAIFEKLVDSYDLQQYADSTGIRGRAYYELALLHQMNRGDYESAKAAYEEAKKAQDSSIARTASRRVLALEKLEKLRNSDSTKSLTAQDRYIIGELFQFDLNEPDSAFNRFRELADAQLGDSTVRPRAMSMAALIARTDLNDTLRSDSLLKLVIKEYEGSDYARKAQELMGVPVTVITRQEKAEKDFRKAEKLYYEKGDVVEAVKNYYDVYNNFQDLDIAAKSLYAAAWHTDNDLQKNRVAMKLYQKLCDQYPQSEYCESKAKPRLAIVKDTLEALRAAGGEDQNESEAEKKVNSDKNTQPVQPVKSAPPSQQNRTGPSPSAGESREKSRSKGKEGERPSPESSPED